MSRPMTPLLARVFTHTEVTAGGCWLWTGATTNGYGVVGLGSREAGTKQVHRALYELIHGSLPEGWQVDHLCRTRHCINPSHLEGVTQHENLRRQAAANLADRTTCRRGHDRATHGRIETDKDGQFRKYVCRACERLGRQRIAA